jgi:hypothetical protein
MTMAAAERVSASTVMLVLTRVVVTSWIKIVFTVSLPGGAIGRKMQQIGGQVAGLGGPIRGMTQSIPDDFVMFRESRYPVGRDR